MANIYEKDIISNLALQHASKQEWVKKAEILCEALPYLRKFSGETFVIKFGGSAMGKDNNLKNFAKNVVLLKQIGINPVVVHGGGPQIGQMLEKLNMKSTFIDGLRVTDADTVDVVEMVLAGSINKAIVSEINQALGKAIGICGKDCNFIKAKKATKTKKDPHSNIEKILNLGYVGEPYFVDPTMLTLFEESDIIPVIAPSGSFAALSSTPCNLVTIYNSTSATISIKRTGNSFAMPLKSDNSIDINVTSNANEVSVSSTTIELTASAMIVTF